MIISRASRPSTPLRAPRAAVEGRLPRLLAGAAALTGVAAWVVFFRAGLVLSHYDAKAHLVVARRVIDNLTPGWQQIGAVWLPLPHLIELLPTQIDLFYRTGAFASLVSIACLATTTWAAARLILRVTGSSLGAATCAALLVLNPNLLYLHTTPMTEPLLLAASMLAVLWLVEWVDEDRDTVPPKLAAVLFAAAWTRYEAWAVIGAALAAAEYAAWRRGPSTIARGPLSEVEGGADARTLIRRGWRLVIWPASAVIVFLINSRITVGAWLVSDGFYVPDPTYQHQPLRTLVAIWWGTHQLSGYVIEVVALTAALIIAVRALMRRENSSMLVTLALFASATLPLLAFHQGHPYRIRYMIPVVAACALFCGLAVGLMSRTWKVRAARIQLGSRTLKVRAAHKGEGVGAASYSGFALAVILIGSTLVESPPWDMQAPMLLEAQWDRGASMGRRDVTACLARDYRGEKILASMGSLAHYMQELSGSGFAIADFVNEGNGVIWNMALQTGPAPHAGWMLVEEVAEGGDVLAERVRRDPGFTRGMTRVCEGGGVALYKRDGMQNAKSKMQTLPTVQALPGGSSK